VLRLIFTLAAIFFRVAPDFYFSGYSLHRYDGDGHSLTNLKQVKTPVFVMKLKWH